MNGFFIFFIVILIFSILIDCICNEHFFETLVTYIYILTVTFIITAILTRV